MIGYANRLELLVSLYARDNSSTPFVTSPNYDETLS